MKNEERDIYTIPPNFIEGGTLLGGMFRTRNVVEAGILAVGKMEKKPAVRNDELVICPLMQLSLTYDHRIVDGAPAALFLRRVKELLENPGLLL